MAHVKMYGTTICPYCIRAEKLLLARGVVGLEKILVDRDPEKRIEMMALTNNARTVPQIFIDNKLIGGYDDLAALDKAGGLLPLLKAA